MSNGYPQCMSTMDSTAQHGNSITQNMAVVMIRVPPGFLIGKKVRRRGVKACKGYGRDRNGLNGKGKTEMVQTDMEGTEMLQMGSNEKAKWTKVWTVGFRQRLD